MFLATTGLRIGELITLTKEDVDLDRGVVHIRRKQLPGSNDVWEPKHGSQRDVPLNAESQAIARRAYERPCGPWLFFDPDGGQLNYRRLRAALGRTKRAAGVKRGTLHSFRHSFCSFMARQPNVTAFDVMKLMGHSSLDIVLTYFHATDNHLCEAMAHTSFAELTTPAITKGCDAPPQSSDAAK